MKNRKRSNAPNGPKSINYIIDILYVDESDCLTLTNQIQNVCQAIQPKLPADKILIDNIKTLVSVL